ncbi:hypothetical protein F400_gp063 [Bacillus phage BCD7]|uniref:Uncharacterized protein n=1 Tax=Bacillus phage BCD7 TaxID=1136534 RepID=J9PVA9_9CAUD|nr:hypothetical protein F400_gp063 [Bacillus phage BCD7]AEZ50510.1 hypothetical protein BCD7_0063 [Bacillus phage BCD7]
MRPDRSKVVNLFDKKDIVDFSAQRMQPKKKAEKKTANQKNKEKFQARLDEGEFHEFDHKDWYQYFVMKFEEQGSRYIQTNYARDYAIIKSVLDNMGWSNLKDMIDFVFDSGQDITDTRTVGVWIISKGWLQSIYQNTQLWKAGEYKTKNAPKRNREWIAEASEKPKNDDALELGAKPKKTIKRKKIKTKKVESTGGDIFL